MGSRLEIPPRVRLSRHTQSFNATVDDSRDFALTHASGGTLDTDDESDRFSANSDSTPRLARTRVPSIDSDGLPDFSTNAQALSTPAPDVALMRAVRGHPPSSATPVPRTFGAGPRRPNSPASSLRDLDMDSEFETPRAPNGMAATPYSAKDRASPPMSLKSVEHERISAIFTRARREPGDTPAKPPRPRQRSIDSSVAEVSPIKWSKFGAGMLSKLSLSDKFSISDDETERDQVAPYGHAATAGGEPSKTSVYSFLRERITNSNLGAKTNAGPSMTNWTIDMEEATEVEQALLSEQEYESRPPTLPLQTKPRRQSISQFPSKFLGSDLLGSDIDMHKLIRDAAPTESESEEESITARQPTRRSPQKNGSMLYSISRKESLESLSRASTLSTSSIHGMQSSFNIPASASALERTQLNAFMGRQRHNERNGNESDTRLDFVDHTGAPGPSSLSNGRLSPVSIDVTESTVESSNQGSGSTVKGHAGSPRSSSSTIHINGDTNSKKGVPANPSRKSKSSSALEIPSERPSRTLLKQKEQRDQVDVFNSVHDSVIRPAPVYASQRSLHSNNLRHNVTPERMDVLESDLESFQEEDIVASSSVPRLNGASLTSVINSNNTQFQTAEFDESERSDAEEPSMTKPSRIMRRSFSPPPTPPKDSADPISTPKRSRNNTTATSIDFKTPSPPKGMPALPDPPSEEDADSDKPLLTARLPLTPVQGNRTLNAKTPRPPGAWATPFSKPAPVPIMRSRLVEVNGSAPSSSSNVIATPPASYSRATITKTPAPPGAWLATPGTVAAKRVQQKVRFDEQQIVASGPDLPSLAESSVTSEYSQADGSVAIKGLGRPTQPPRSPRRIRVLDAFGNEIAQSQTKRENPESKTEPALAVSQSYPGASTRNGSKNFNLGSDAKSRRGLSDDSTGIFVDEEQVKQDGRLDCSKALRRLKSSITALKTDFDEMDQLSLGTQTASFNKQIESLRAESSRALKYRESIRTKMKNVGRKSYLRSILRFLASGLQPSKILMLFLVTQFILLFAFYRLSAFSAQRMYLTKYIDPFYREFDLQFFDADLFRRVSLSPMAANSSPTHSILIRISEYTWADVFERLLEAFESSVDTWNDPFRPRPAWRPT